MPMADDLRSSEAVAILIYTTCSRTHPGPPGTADAFEQDIQVGQFEGGGGDMA